MSLKSSLCLLAAAFVFPAWPQPPQGPRTVSPEVHSDGRITFRLRGPEAQSVVLNAPWAGGEIPLVKGEDGVWSITIGPVEPDILDYTYRIDGVRTIDPHNPRVKLWLGGAASLVEVPAEAPTYYDVQDVPHGDLHVHWFRSSASNRPRRVFVYTPPGYAASGERLYPVLYLLHGAGDDESTWSEVGRAPLILDNLIAAGKVEPMIVVMPNGHPVRFGEASRGTGNRNTELFVDELVKDVIPLIESRYRVHKDRRKRAIAGLSMGGGQSLAAGLSRAELFAYVGAFSSAAPDPVEDAAVKGFTADPRKTNRETALLWIAVGEKDFLLKRNQVFVEHLKEHGIRHTYLETPGDHSWPVWRRYLRDFTPLLFR